MHYLFLYTGLFLTICLAILSIISLGSPLFLRDLRALISASVFGVIDVSVVFLLFGFIVTPDY